MREAGNSEQARLLVQHGFHFVQGEAFLRGDEAQDGRIDVAGPRSHHQAFERRHAHGRVHGTPAANGRGGTSVSEMKAHDVGLLPRQIANRAVAIGHVPVGDAVESVAADAVAQIEMVRNRVQVGMLGKRVVKRGIEYGDLRNLRAQQIAHRANSAKVRGIVQAERDRCNSRFPSSLRR